MESIDWIGQCWTMPHTNEFGQPVGEDIGGWTPPRFIRHDALSGKHVSVRPLGEVDADDIYEAFMDASPSMFTYMSFDPFRGAADVQSLIEFIESQPDWLGYLFEIGGRIEGFAAYLRVNPGDGVVEIGSIMFSTRMQKTTAATEALLLMVSHAFDSGYRRVEWKCDALNEPSRKAGERLGFSYEGTFRNATHYKGRNRDTAWFAITAEDWPEVRSALTSWLEPANFGADGSQISALAQVREGR